MSIILIIIVPIVCAIVVAAIVSLISFYYVFPYEMDKFHQQMRSQYGGDPSGGILTFGAPSIIGFDILCEYVVPGLAVGFIVGCYISYKFLM